jgi:hypothetical protein
MDPITIRIDLGSARVHLAGSVFSVPVSVEVPIDRLALAQLIAGGPLPAPIAAAVEATPVPEPVALPAAPPAQEPEPTQPEVIAQPRSEPEPPVSLAVKPRKTPAAEKPRTVGRKGPVRALAGHTDDHLREKLSSMRAELAAEFFGCSVQTIYKERTRLGIARVTAPAKPVVIGERKSLTDISDVELRELLASGTPWDDIASEYGTTINAINAEGRRLNVQQPSRRQEVIRSLSDLSFLNGANTGGDQRGAHE